MRAATSPNWFLWNSFHPWWPIPHMVEYDRLLIPNTLGAPSVFGSFEDRVKKCFLCPELIPESCRFSLNLWLQDVNPAACRATNIIFKKNNFWFFFVSSSRQQWSIVSLREKHNCYRCCEDNGIFPYVSWSQVQHQSITLEHTFENNSSCYL